MHRGMTMHKRRSLFVTGVLLSALVLFGTTTASAQSLAAVFVEGVTTAALDHDSIRVRWTIADEDAANFSKITAFEIRYQEGTGTTSTPVDPNEPFMYAEADVDDRSIVVNELEHSMWYAFQVRAVDTEGVLPADLGETDWAPTATTPGGEAADHVEKTDLAEGPEQVKDLELVAGDMMIMATWDEADTDKDFPLTGYELKITPKDGSANIMNIGVMEAYTFENLMNGTEYTVQVAARNEIAPGTYSDKEMATPMAGATPTPALPIFGAFALGAGLLGGGSAASAPSAAVAEQLDLSSSFLVRSGVPYPHGAPTACRFLGPPAFPSRQSERTQAVEAQLGQRFVH